MILDSREINTLEKPKLSVPPVEPACLASKGLVKKTKAAISLSQHGLPTKSREVLRLSCLAVLGSALVPLVGTLCSAFHTELDDKEVLGSQEGYLYVRVSVYFNYVYLTL